jgi:hypothetical protein
MIHHARVWWGRKVTRNASRLSLNNHGALCELIPWSRSSLGRDAASSVAFFAMILLFATHPDQDRSHRTDEQITSTRKERKRATKRGCEEGKAGSEMSTLLDKKCKERRSRRGESHTGERKEQVGRDYACQSFLRTNDHSKSTGTKRRIEISFARLRIEL